MKRISLLLVGACALLLGGCLSSRPTPVVKQYALPNADAAVEAVKTHGHGVLGMARIDVPDWLEGTAMYYRLDYRANHPLASYALSDWAAPPATLLQPLLQQALRDGGAWQAVVGPSSRANADATLQIRLDDFSQHFTAPQHSVAVIRGVATLVDNRDHRVIAQRPFRISVPSPSADAEGGVQALGKAGQKLAKRLDVWVAKHHHEP